MKVDSIIQRIDAVLDGPVCIRPGCCAPALPWLSPWCTPDCQRTHWAATRAEAVTDRPVLETSNPWSAFAAQSFAAADTYLREIQGTELSGAWLDEVDWLEWHTAEADDQRPRHPACVDARCRGSLVCRRTPCTVEPKQDREVIYTTSTPDPPGSWFRSLLARWHGR